MRISTSKNTLKFNRELALFFILVALFFDPTIQDPFNVSKQILLFFFAGWFFGYLVVKRKTLFNSLLENRLLSVGLSLFTMGIFIALVRTKPFYTGFFGENLRKNGFLTYICLIIIVLAIYEYYSLELIQNLKSVFLVVGIVVGIYGLFQSNGIDLFAWNNPYNSIIGTLGNPNFAAAMMAMVASYFFIRIFEANLNILKKLLFASMVTLLIYNIVQSNSRQGIIAFVFSSGFTIYFIIRDKNKFISKIYLTLFFLTSILGVLGILQKGPLTQVLYKESVSIRGYYWRAAIRMFREQPWFGVGVDSYGSYFKEFREVNYPLKYGFEITSSNAHSVPLQFLATCGIFSFIGFMIFQFCVLKGSLKNIKNSRDSEKNLFLAIFSSWLAYQSQSIISIDQIALAAWGWMLGGVILGHNKLNNLNGNQANKISANLSTSKKSAQKVISFLCVVLIVVPVSFIYRGEKSMWVTRSLAGSLSANNNDAKLRELVTSSAEKTKSVILQDPYYIFLASTYESDYGLTNLGLESLKKLLVSNPRNQDYLNALAFYSEKNGNLIEALEYRKKLGKFDPYNAKNYLQMGRTYKYLGDYNNMNLMREKILSFAAETDVGQSAKTELKLP